MKRDVRIIELMRNQHVCNEDGEPLYFDKDKMETGTSKTNTPILRNIKKISMPDILGIVNGRLVKVNGHIKYKPKKV